MEDSKGAVEINEKEKDRREEAGGRTKRRVEIRGKIGSAHICIWIHRPRTKCKYNVHTCTCMCIIAMMYNAHVHKHVVTDLLHLWVC